MSGARTSGDDRVRLRIRCRHRADRFGTEATRLEGDEALDGVIKNAVSENEVHAEDDAWREVLDDVTSKVHTG